MNILISIAIILSVIAIFSIFNISPNNLIELLEKSTHKNPDKWKKKSKSKPNPILNALKQIQRMLEMTGQQSNFTFILLSTFVLIIAGVNLAIYLNNIFLIPVLALSLGAIPYIFLKIQYIEFQQMQIAELSEAIKHITSSYMRNENILLSIEENLENINEPAKEIFVSFVRELKTINPSHELAIDNMKEKINNNVWIEWCEALKRCVNNRTLKHVLLPIVTKFTKVKVINGEIRTLLNNAIKNFWVLFFATLVLLYMGVYMFPASLMIEISSWLSNVLVAINLSVSIFVGIKVVFITRNIDYDL